MAIRLNLVHVATARFTLLCELACDDAAPGFARDHAAVQTFTDSHSELLDRMSFDDIGELYLTQFPRINAIQVTDSETKCGLCLLRCDDEN